MKALYEQFRPRTWDELVGQDKLVAKMAVLRRRGLVGRVFWVTGDSGTGKTTVARLIASEIADDYAVVEIDAQDVGMDRVREFERMCQFKPLGKGCHVFIVQRGPRAVVQGGQPPANGPGAGQRPAEFDVDLHDDLPGPATSCSTMPSTPARSCRRAIELTLEHGEDVVLAFAVRARKIAQTEQLDGKPLEDYVRLVRQSGCNMRKVLQQIEAGEMSGRLTGGRRFPGFRRIARLVAAAERIAARFLHHPCLREDCTMQCYEHLKLKTNVKRINGSMDVAPVFRAILDAESELDRDKEHFWILCLNTKNHILRVELVTLGLLDQTVVHPREVFRPAIGCSAKSIILAHNHPSAAIRRQATRTRR